jgi:hypothetical protein
MRRNTPRHDRTEAEAARKIAEAFRALGHDAIAETTPAGDPIVVLRDQDMSISVEEASRSRTGTWNLRVVPTRVETKVCCPGTHAEVSEDERASLTYLVHETKKLRETVKTNTERRAKVAAASNVLGDLRNGRGGGHTRVRAVVEWLTTCTADVDPEAKFVAYVPVEHAEEFARTISRFFEAMKAKDEPPPDAA